MKSGIFLLFMFLAGSLPFLAQDNPPKSHCLSAKPEPPLPTSGRAPRLMTGIGKASLTITTKSPRVQRYFNQGLALLHCFWGNEARRSFQEAIRLDPNCAMAYWGIYQVMSNPFTGGANPEEKKEALDKAVALSSGGSPHEQAYIKAIETREALGGKKGRLAYHQAMESLIADYPNDLQAKLFLAQFLFVYDFSYTFNLTGEPSKNRQRSLELIKEVLATDPNNAAAHHYWIHVVEGTNHPESALNSARILSHLAPASGHMVHMPGHIYFRLGNYELARHAFLASLKVEKDYFIQNRINPELLWNYSHNLSFLAMNCAEDGRYREGLKWSRLGIPDTDPGIFNLRYAFWDKAVREFEDPGFIAANAEESPFIKNFYRGLIAFCKGMASIDAGDSAEATRQAESLDQTLMAMNATTLSEEEAYDLEFLPKILVKSP